MSSKPKKNPTAKTAKSKAKTKAASPAKAKTRAKTAKPKVTKTRTPRAKKVVGQDYDALLARAREQIPPEVFDQPRFQIPKLDSFVQGARTVIQNFKEMTDTLRRDPKHLLRYLSHELATAGEIRGSQAIFNGRFSPKALEELVEKYTQEFVVCPICNRPDTEIRREDRLLILRCTACGGRTPLKG